MIIEIKTGLGGPESNDLSIVKWWEQFFNE